MKCAVCGAPGSLLRHEESLCDFCYDWFIDQIVKLRICEVIDYL